MQPNRFVTLFAMEFYFFLGEFLSVTLAAQYGQVMKFVRLIRAGQGRHNCVDVYSVLSREN